MPRARQFEWYKRFPKQFIAGAQGLGADVIGCYSMVVDLIYERGEGCPNDPQFIGALLGESGRKASGLVKMLLDRGKLYIDEHGRLMNPRAAEELGLRVNPPEKTGDNASTMPRQGLDDAETAPRRAFDATPADSKDKGLRNRAGTHLDETRREKIREEDPPTPLKPATARAAPNGAAKPSEPSAKRGTRWTKDQEVPVEWVEAARARRVRAGLPDVDLRAEIENFKTYWPGVPGARGLKIDWQATFENSCLRARSTPESGRRFGAQHEPDPHAFQDANTDGWIERLKIYYGWRESEGTKKGGWILRWGPPPDQRGTRVPKAAWDAFRALTPPPGAVRPL